MKLNIRSGIYFTSTLTLWIMLFTVRMQGQLPDLTFRYLDYRDGLPQYSVLDAMVTDHLGRLWFGYSTGLYRFDGYEMQTFVPNINDSTALSEIIINTLFVDPQNRIWIGTRNMGICIHEPETDRFTRILPQALGGPLPESTIWDIHLDQNGIFWIASEPGLIRHDPNTGSFKHFRFSDANLPEEHLAYINTMRNIRDSPTDSNILWIGTRGGLLSFNKASENFTFHPMPFSSAEIGLKDIDYMLFKMLFTSDEDLWASSWGGGIFHYHIPTAKWRQFRNPHIAPNDDIGFCLEKRDNRSFWFGTSGAFGIFDHQDLAYHFFRTTTEAPGALRWSQMFSVFLQTADSALVIGGTLGINISIAPNEGPVVHSRYPFTPLLTKILVNHQPFPTRESLHQTTAISLDKDQNTLQFTVALPSYRDPQKVQYRYLLEGIDDTWTESGLNRTVQYTDLSPGRYTFRYQASLDGKRWIDGKTSPDIHITQPFWQHPLFVTGLILLVLGVVALFIHLRIRNIRREVKLKLEYNQRIAENEMKALRAQMNPHFMFNSLNSIKHYILKENKKDASKYLTKFSQLMRAILANSEHKLVSLHDELHALNLYLEIETMRFNEEFQYNIVVGTGIDPSHVFIPPLLIQPFVENAIWHGLLPKESERRLDIQISDSNGMLEIRIEDNGIGRKAAALRNAARNGHEKSMGMKLTTDRIALVRNMLDIHADVVLYDLEEDDGSAKGTRVVITIPIIDKIMAGKEQAIS